MQYFSSLEMSSEIGIAVDKNVSFVCLETDSKSVVIKALSSHPAITKTGMPNSCCLVNQFFCWLLKLNFTLDVFLEGRVGVYLYSTKHQAPGPA